MNIRSKLSRRAAIRRLVLAAGVCIFNAQQARAHGAPGAVSSTSSQGESQGLQEIVVTANKRTENLQDVPIAVTVVTGDALENLGIKNTVDLSRVVSGLTLRPYLGGVVTTLRGVGANTITVGSENSTAIFVDGVYLRSLTSALVQMNNIANVEVLKGPQGTLFGRNATAGVINIRTRDPGNELSGNIRIIYENYNTASGQAYFSGPLADNISADIGGFFSVQGKGWGKNLINGKDVNDLDEYSVRSKWIFTATERDTIRLIGDYSKVKGTRLAVSTIVPGSTSNYGPGNTNAGQRPDLASYVAGGFLQPLAVVGDAFTFKGGFYDTLMSDPEPLYLSNNWGISLQWDHDFGGVRLTNITAYRRGTFDSVLNQPYGAPRLVADWHDKDSSFSEELQLRPAAGASVQWVAGLYYLDSPGKRDPFNVMGTPLAPLERIVYLASVNIRSIAGFGQATIPLWTGAHLTGGLRYTIERRGLNGHTEIYFNPIFGIPPTITGFTDAHRTFRKLTWRIAIDQELAPDIMGYVSYNRGFKSGLYNAIPPGGPTAKPAKPEILDAYEAGLKTELLDRRLRLNFAGFYYDYKDIQVTVAQFASSTVTNGAGSYVYGADVDLTAKVGRNLMLNLGATLLRSRFTSYQGAQAFIPVPPSQGGGAVQVIVDAKGNRLPFSPNLTFNIGADYTAPLAGGDLNINLNYSFTGQQFGDAGNSQSLSQYGVLDGSIICHFGDHLEFGVRAQNITNNRYYLVRLGGSNPGGQFTGTPGAPRTYGVMVGYRF